MGWDSLSLLTRRAYFRCVYSSRRWTDGTAASVSKGIIGAVLNTPRIFRSTRFCSFLACLRKAPVFFPQSSQPQSELLITHALYSCLTVAGESPRSTFTRRERWSRAFRAELILLATCSLNDRRGSKKTPSQRTTLRGSTTEPIGKVIFVVAASFEFIKWISSVLSGSKIIPLSLPRLKRRLTSSSIIFLLRFKLPELAISVISLIQERQEASIDGNISQRQIRNKIGETGLPWGIPVSILLKSSVSPLNASPRSRLFINKRIYASRFSGSPILAITASSYS